MSNRLIMIATLIAMVLLSISAAFAQVDSFMINVRKNIEKAEKEKALRSDDDTLVYDWYTTGIVRIKGLPSWDCCAIYNTFEHSHIFYAPDSAHVSAPQDTFWVQCAARDGKGGQDVKLIHFETSEKPFSSLCHSEQSEEFFSFSRDKMFRSAQHDN
jgi:hypothetical protein